MSKEIDIMDMKVSKLVKMLFEIYRALFTKGVETEEEALFAKALVDFNTRGLISSMELGLQEKTIPIAIVSVWQSILSGDESLFKIRLESVGGVPELENNTQLLLEKINDAINEWGRETFEDVVTVSDKDINPHGASWVIEKKDKDDE